MKELLTVCDRILSVAEPCERCAGTGQNPYAPEDACRDCGGVGETCDATGEIQALRAAIDQARGE